MSARYSGAPCAKRRIPAAAEAVLARLELTLLGLELSLYGVLGLWLVAGLGLPAVAVVPLLALLPVAARALYLARAFRLAGVSRRGRPMSHLLRLFAGEWFALVATHSILQPLRRWLDPAPVSCSGKASCPLLVFVHGYCCNAAYWRPMSRQLRARGWGHQIAFDIEPVFADIDRLADAFLEAYGARPEETRRVPCIVIAHSMGGLVVRAALQRAHAAIPIAALVTVGTPHAGTRLARGAPGRNARQMAPDSEWLKALNQSARKPTARVLAIASRDDELVAPWSSALACPGARQTVLEGMGHLALGRHRDVAAAIDGEIRRALQTAACR